MITQSEILESVIRENIDLKDRIKDLEYRIESVSGCKCSKTDGWYALGFGGGK